MKGGVHYADYAVAAERALVGNEKYEHAKNLLLLDGIFRDANGLAAIALYKT